MNLIQCVKDNDVKTLKTLIVERVNVDAVDRYGCTALWWAANRGHVECAAALLNAKADVDKADGNSHTPLHWASNYGHVECLRVRR
jgi:CDK inhibitor PHO81